MKKLLLAIIFACCTLAIAAQEGAAFKGRKVRASWGWGI